MAILPKFRLHQSAGGAKGRFPLVARSIPATARQFDSNLRGADSAWAPLIQRDREARRGQWRFRRLAQY
jgi:hypothetical protein